MKNILLGFLAVLFLTFSLQAQKATFNDKSDISVTYQFLSKNVDFENLKSNLDRDGNEHGVLVGGTYYFGNKALGLTSEVGVSGGNGNSTLSLMSGVTAKRRKGTIKPFAVGLVGFSRERALADQFRFPNRRDTDTNVGYSLGAGIDVKLSRTVDFRLIRADYVSTFGHRNHFDGHSRVNPAVRFSSGFIF